jgi:AraC family transcriptional regulator, positive regulator of tynA and feaB
MLVFDSDQFSPRERLDAWEDFMARKLAAMRCVPAGDKRVQVRADTRAVGEIAMARITCSGYVSERASHHVARERHEYYAAVFHLDGGPTVRCRKGIFQACPRDVSILSSMDQMRIGLERPCDHISVMLPQRLPWSHVAVPGAIVPASNPLRGIVFDYVASVYAQADQLSSSSAALLGGNLTELMFAMFCEEPVRVSTCTSLRAALFDRACRIIAHNAYDPELHPAEVARQLGISMRTLQRIFQENGETVAQRIARARVHKSSIMLGDERMRACTITEIAFACGFRDLTTFERAFSAIKGMTPSSWRCGASEVGVTLSPNEAIAPDPLSASSP